MWICKFALPSCTFIVICIYVQLQETVTVYVIKKYIKELLKVRLLAELFFTRWLFLSRFCQMMSGVDGPGILSLSHWNSVACKPGGNTTVTSPSTLPIGVSLERTLMLKKYSISSRVVIEILHVHLLKVILCASEHICSIVRYCFRSFKQL